MIHWKKINFNLTLNHLIVFILSSSITFYASKFTQFSPIYIIYIFIFPLAIYTIVRNKFITYSLDAMIALILIIYISLTQFQYLFSGEFINLFISLYSYIYIRINVNKFSEEILLKIFNKMLWISIILLSIDSIYRIMNPSAPTAEAFAALEASENLFFYLYKFNSLMFADSNTTALICLILFFTIFSIQKEIKNVYYKNEKFILLLLLFSCLSRAAILSLIVGLIFLLLFNSNISKIVKTFFLFLLIIATVFVVVFNDSLSTDESLKSKFQIIIMVYLKIQTLSFSELLFGIGFTQVESFLGIYSHLLILTYLIECGIIGLLIFLTFIGFYIFKYNSIVLLPILVVSLSYFLYAGTPFLFIPLAIIANIIDFKRRKKYE